MPRLGLAIVVLIALTACQSAAESSFVAKSPQAYLGTAVGNGHCVKYVQAATGVPRTVEWGAGAVVRGNPGLAPGTAIATFEKDGTYTSARGNHAAIYISQDDQGIWVYDQWRGQPVHKRLIRFQGGRGADRGIKSNNANLYRVIVSKSAGDVQEALAGRGLEITE